MNQFENKEPFSPEGDVNERAVGGLNGLLGETKEEISQLEKRSEPIESPHEREAYRELKPKIDALMEMIRQSHLFKGKQDYFSLKEDFDGYKKAVFEDVSHKYDLSLLYEEIAKDYKEATGQEFYIGGTPLEFQEDRFDYTDGGYDHLGGKSKEDYLADKIVQDEKVLHDYMLGNKDTLQGLTRNPEEYIENLKKVREYHHSDQYRPGIDDKGKKIDDVVYQYDTKAQGFALGALEAGDLQMAAKALAFAESIQKMDEIVTELVRERIAALTPDQKRKFIEYFDQEKD